MSLLHDLVGCAFHDEIPDDVLAVLPPTGTEDPLAFGAAPLLCLDRHRRARGARVYVANTRGDGPFLDRVLPVIDDDRAEPFYAALPRARKMLDTDGVTHTLYLDDLQQVDHDLAVPEGLTLMCDTLLLPDGARTQLTRHPTPPHAHLPPVWQATLDKALGQGLRGLWAVRWSGQGVHSLLCVNEDRYRGSVEPSATRLDTLIDDPRWHALRARVRADGLVAYADAVELHADGGWDLTVGLARR